MSTHYFRLAPSASLRQRSLLLEQLLSRCDSSTEVTDWRTDAFRIIAPPMTEMPGVGATALYAALGAVQGASVMMATPVRYVAEMSNVRLPADGILALRPSEAQLLAGDFNRVWHDAGIRLLSAGAALFCVADEPLQAATHDPKEILDRHIDDQLPTGADAPRLRRLMSEIEMWLFEHAVNRSRIAAAAPAVGGLWLWGGGAALNSLPQIRGWTAGQDPFFSAFTPRTEAVRSSLPGVTVIAAEPGSAEWSGIESGWLGPSLNDLRSGRIARLEFSAGTRKFTLSARCSRRFWRRRRAWWEFLA